MLIREESLEVYMFFMPKKWSSSSHIESHVLSHIITRHGYDFPLYSPRKLLINIINMHICGEIQTYINSICTSLIGLDWLWLCWKYCNDDLKQLQFQFLNLHASIDSTSRLFTPKQQFGRLFLGTTEVKLCSHGGDWNRLTRPRLTYCETIVASQLQFPRN